jgi:N12 class adenine-specific DNA methylase
MPIYNIGGKTFNIPDNLADKFEAENSDATMQMNADGRNFDIPVGKKKEFLEQFKDAGVGYMKAEGEGHQPSTAAGEAGVKAQGMGTEIGEGAQGAGARAVVQQPSTAADEAGVKAPGTGAEKVEPVEQKKEGLDYSRLDPKYQVNEDGTVKPFSVLESEASRDSEGNKVWTPKLVTNEKGEQVYRDMNGREYSPEDARTRELVGENTMVASSMPNLKAVTRTQVTELGDEISERMKVLGDELDKAAGSGSFLQNMTRGGGIGAVPDYVTTNNGRMTDERYKALQTAGNAMRDAKALIEEADKAQKEGNFEGFVKGAGRGFGEKFFDVRTWDMGLSDAVTMGQLTTTLQKVDKGQPISEEEQMMLDAKAIELATQAYFGSYVGRGYKAGEVTAESLPFMMEMCINPASTAGESAQSMLTRYALKRFGKKVVKDNSKKYVAAKVTSRVVGDLAGSAAMTATTGAARTWGDAEQRMQGDIRFGTDEETGESYYDGHEDGDSFSTALGKAFAATTIENYSEMVGEYFAPAAGLMADWTKKGLSKIGLGKVNDFIENVAMSDVAKLVSDFEKHSKWSGNLGEFMEEQVGGIMNAIVVGDQTLDTAEGTGVFNMDNMIDTFLGVGLMGGAISSVKMLGYRTPKYRARKDMTKADDAASALWANQEEWGEIRNTIAFAEDDVVKERLAEVMADDELSDAQKRAVLNYAEKVEEYKGVMMGEQKRRGEEENEAQLDAESSFDNGYSLSSPDEMNDAKNMLDMQRGRAEELLPAFLLDALDGSITGTDEGGNPVRITTDPVAQLTALYADDAYSDEQKQVALDYLNAKATYDGMIQHVRDDIDSKMAQSDATIASREGRGDNAGYIQPATLKQDDRKVYVIDGQVKMHDDGSMVDVSGSSESILVRDEKTGNLEFLSPRDVLSVGERLPAEQVREEAREAIRQSVAHEMGDQIDGKLTFGQGETCSVIGPDGQKHTTTMVADNGDGTVQVAWDGDMENLQTIGKEQLQAMSQAEGIGRAQEYVAQRDAQRQQEKQEEAAEEYEKQRPVYALNDEVTLRDQDGNPVRGSIISEANADGQYEVMTESPLNGHTVSMLSRDELDGMIMEQNGERVEMAQRPRSADEGTGVNTPGTVVAEGAGETGQQPSTAADGAQGAGARAENGENATGTGVAEGTGVNTPGTVAAEEEGPMPMVGEGEDQEPDFMGVSPKRGMRYLYDESGLEEADATAFLNNNVAASKKEADKIKAKKPKMGTSIAKYNREMAEWNRKVEEAEKKAEYWNQMQAERKQVTDARKMEQRLRDAEAHDEAVKAEEAYRLEQEQKAAEMAAVGSNAVHPAIKEKWDKANKTEGSKDEIVLANGEKISGRYMLVESDAPTASHDAENGFVKSEGFPQDENGGSVNDRDYERDEDAQQQTRMIADNYDSRALQTPVVVSQDGVVLSGNGRTMAGKLAAKQGTDQAYTDYLMGHAGKYGFTAEQVQGMQHPRVVFVADGAQPYTAETFAKFNAQEMKSQSKTEAAVKLGKVVDDATFGRILSLINAFDKLGDFYADNKSAAEAIGELQKAGVLSSAQVAEMFDGEGISAIGRDMLENMLIGKAFESNPDAVRELTAMRGVRQAVVMALTEIANNVKLGEDYSLAEQLAGAIDLVYKATKEGKYKEGDRVSGFARQLNLGFYGEEVTVADANNATMLEIADLLNSGYPTRLRTYLQDYNRMSEESAAGQLDLWSGEVKSREDILNEVNQLFNNGTEQETERGAEGPAQADAVNDGVQEGNEGEGVAEDQQPSTAAGETGVETSGTGAEGAGAPAEGAGVEAPGTVAAEEGKKAMREEEAKSARVDQLVTETVATALRENAGIKVVEETQEEGQRVAREMREGVEMMSASKKRALETASLTSESQDHSTVVSSADGAKVLENLRKLKNEYENVSNRGKTFLGDVALALGAVKHGSNSEYATFETVGGKVVTIRLANHNAKVSNFDNRGEEEGISIVITNSENNGVQNDGTAHIVEFFFKAIKLARSEGKPLVDIIDSIEQALYSGEFKDKTGLAEVEEVNGTDIEMMQVWHGSGAIFDHFDGAFLGTGEGSYVYGAGHYVSQERGIGESYAAIAAKDKSRHLYEVEIPEDNGSNYLDYNDALGTGLLKSVYAELDGSGRGEVADAVHEQLTAVRKEGKDMKFYHLYKALSSALGGDRAASDFLAGMGYTGIRVRTNNNSVNGDHSKNNYVLFRDGDLKIQNRVDFMTTPDGTVYGWAVGNEIHLTPEGLNANTMVHEYTHLWAKAMRRANPKAWRGIVEMLKGTPVWATVVNDPAYQGLADDDAIASEVLSRYSGVNNALKLKEMAEEAIEEGGDEATVNGLMARVRRALERFWSWVGKNLFEIESFKNVEEVTDRVLYDLINKTDLNEQVKASESAKEPAAQGAGARAEEQWPNLAAAVAEAEKETETNPSDGQKKAGNYKMGHVKIDGYDISIENPKGSVRSGKDADGNEWSVTMNNTYGYIRGTEGVDGDHIDVFLSDNPEQGNVFVVDQVNADGSFDEHKVMYGFASAQEARDAYLANYSAGWTGLGTITEVSKDEFKKWINSSHRKTKPFAEYKNVKVSEMEQPSTAAGDGYTIEDTQYTTKRGKKLEMKVVKFENLSKEQMRAAKAMAKELNGWYSLDHKGFLMRSQEDAEKLAGQVMGNEAAVNDAQPVSVSDMREVAEVAQQPNLAAESAGAPAVEATEAAAEETGVEAPGTVAAEESPYKVGDRVMYRNYEMEVAEVHPDGTMELRGNAMAMNVTQMGISPSEVRKPGGEESVEFYRREFEDKIKKENYDMTFLNKVLAQVDKNIDELAAKLEGGKGSVAQVEGMARLLGMRKAVTEKIDGITEAKERAKRDEERQKALDQAMDSEEGKRAKELFDSIKEGDVLTNGRGLTARVEVKSQRKKKNSDLVRLQITQKVENGPDGRTAKILNPLTLLQWMEANGVKKEEETVAQRPNLAAEKKAAEGEQQPSTAAEGTGVKAPGTVAEAEIGEGAQGAGAEETGVNAPGTVAEEKAGSGNKLVTDERYAALKERMRKKLGQLNVGIDPEMLAIGTEMALYHIEAGARKFAQFAKAMIEDLGDAIRPYLKSFYNGARDLPEVEENGWTEEMTGYDEVRKFDVANFEKAGVDAMATAEMTMQEQVAEKQAEEAIDKIKTTRNNIRNEQEREIAEDAEAVASEGESVASEAWSVAENGTDEEVNEAIAKVDEALKKVNDQLALMGFYEADTNDESAFNESMGYMRSAEKKAKADAKNLARQITNKLGVAANRAEVRTNVAPAGGDITIKIPLTQNREVYIDVMLEPADMMNRGTRDDLVVRGVMYRMEDPQQSGQGRYVSSNHHFGGDAKLAEVLEDMRLLVKYNAPDFVIDEGKNAEVEGKTEGKKQKKQGEKAKGKKKDVSSRQESVMGDLFADLMDEEAAEGAGAPAVEQQPSTAAEGGVNATGTGVEAPGTVAGAGVEAQGTVAEQGTGNNSNDYGKQELERGSGSIRTEGLPANSDNRSEQAGGLGQKAREEGRGADGRGQEGRAGELGSELQQSERLDGQLSEGEAEGQRPNLAADEAGVNTPGTVAERAGETGQQPSTAAEVTGVKATGTVAAVGAGAPAATAMNRGNNHAERGKDYAPKGVDARIEANIKAIELMKQLIESGRKATQAQMKVLRQFSGWGGLGKAFNERIGSGWMAERNPIYTRLKELLDDEEFEQAEMSRNSAYYTPAKVIDAMWDIARALGFKGGRVLEGSAGIGNIIGAMPKDMSDRSQIHAVEIDGTTGNILSLLYPDAQVDVQGFEKTKIQNGTVDLAITNVPFVTGLRVMDDTGDGDLSKRFHDIHDFCIAKNVRKLREGGIGIFISSSGTLDKSQKLREWLVKEGGVDVVGAFRLNNETFGGTGATSDIIVVRKRVAGQKAGNAIDVLGVASERSATYETGELKKAKGGYVKEDKQLQMEYNGYFMEHPEWMAGKMQFGFEQGDTFRPESKALYPVKGKNQEKMLTEWVADMKKRAEEAGVVTAEGAGAPAGGQQPSTAAGAGVNATGTGTGVEAPGTVAGTGVKAPGTVAAGVYDALGEDVKEGSMVVDKSGRLCVAQYGKAVPLAVNDKKVKGHTKVECFEDYQAIKKAVADVLSYQTENEGDSGLKPLLDKLNKAYDAFVQKYGHLHEKRNNTAIAFLKNDVDWPSVLALEKFEEREDKETGERQYSYEKTDVFNQRVVEKEKEPNPTTVKDGIMASVYKYGAVNVGYIAAKLGRNEEDVRKEIIESGLGFENPASGQMEVSYEYLSGNVREKLKYAEEHNEDGRYDANVKALMKVIPMNIPGHLIEFTLGSSWIEPEVFERYMQDRTGVKPKMRNLGGSWLVDMNTGNFNNETNKQFGVFSEVFQEFVYGATIIEAAINNKSITVSKTRKHYDGTTETITDKEATQAVANKIDEIRQDFKEWARQLMQQDPELSKRMEEVYNEQFNNYVPVDIPAEYVPKHFVGQSSKFSMREHQGKAIVRGTMQPLLLAHEVGTGKTFTLISTAMEMRRLGTAKKPMIVVQNATVGQVVASAKELYPNVKVLTLEDKDRTAEGRKNFYANIKYNDWDMIVVPQSVFERIPDSPEREAQYIREKIEEKMEILDKMKEDGGNRSAVMQAEAEIENLQNELGEASQKAIEKRNRRKGSDGKTAAKTKQNAAVKAQEMLDRVVDDVEDFDDMGIDAILVDEAHEYKHLGFATAMQRGVKGIDPSYSKKAQGVFLKAQAVLEKNNGRNVVFATGTPISNTAAEIWTFMRYLMPADQMKAYGIYYFDDFVRNFGSLQTMLEFTTSGKFKENNRFAGYVNLPELVRIWSGVADTVLTREAGKVQEKIPDMEGGKAQDIYLPQTPALRAVMKHVKRVLDEYEKMSGKEKKENSHIPLTMYGIAKAAAVDVRLVQADGEDSPQSKTNEAVRQTLRSLKDSEQYKGTVAIFADNYQNKDSGFNLYDDIREKLIKEGVPEDQVVVIRSGMTTKKKLEIFEKVNRGEIRVVLGSTFTLGTGVNIQERLHTLIHLDAPNRPMDYTQRNGRILRQGNLHKQWGIPVRVMRFGVEDSLDVTAYQRLKTKGAIADSIMGGKQMMQNSMENRALEEEEDVFGDTVAQLSGSEYAMLKNQAEKDVRKWRSKYKQWEADQTYVHNMKPVLEKRIAEFLEWADTYKKRAEQMEEGFKGDRTIHVGSLSFKSVDDMADYLKDHGKKVKEDETRLRMLNYGTKLKREVEVKVGKFAFKIEIEQEKAMENEGGKLRDVIHRTAKLTCEELEVETYARGGYLKSAIEEIMRLAEHGAEEYRRRSENMLEEVEEQRNDLKQITEREGKPFEYSQELIEAAKRLEEYTDKMKEELEAKEAKYAEMDSEAGEAVNLSGAEEDEEDSEVRYRDGGEWQRPSTAADGTGVETPGTVAGTGVKAQGTVAADENDKDLRYSLREQVPPKKTRTAYAVFVVKKHKDGSVSLHPKMIEGDEVGAPPLTWLNADTGAIKRDADGNPKQNTKGRVSVTDSHGAPLAWRPGKHLAPYPNASQFAVEGETKGVRDKMPDNIVFFEVEYAADRDYQMEAWEYGVNANGKYEHSQAGLPYIPKDGFYIYRTNANPKIPAMIITGAYKIKRALTDAEAKELNQKMGGEWFERKGGKPVTSETLSEMGLDKEGLTEKARSFDYEAMEAPHDESAVAMSMPGYVRRDVNFEDKNLLKAIEENRKAGGLEADHYKYMYEKQQAEDRQSQMTEFEENEVIEIKKEGDMYWDGYTHYYVEGLTIPFLSKEQLLEAFREKYQGYVAKLTSDGRGIIVNSWRKVLESLRQNDAKRKAGSKSQRKLEGYIDRKTRYAIDYVMAKAEKLGLNVEIKTDTEGLTGRRARAKGWYDTKTGKITILLQNHTDMTDVMRTLMHEGVAHHGLRQMFGRDFDTFLDNVYANADIEVRKRIADMAAKNGWNFRVATEEYMAGLAEDVDFERKVDQTWWKKVKFFFVDMLRKAGVLLGEKLTDNDLRYILWKSYERMAYAEESGIVRAARAEVMKQELGVGNYAEEQRPRTADDGAQGAGARADGTGVKAPGTGAAEIGADAQGTGAEQRPNLAAADEGPEGLDEEVRYRDGDRMDQRDRAIVRDWYERQILSSTYQFKEAMQDSMLSLKRFMEKVAEVTGQKVKDFENAYMAENALSSKNRAEQEVYGKMLFNPLIDEVHRLAKEDSSRDEVTRYMMAKHGLERQQYMETQAINEASKAGKQAPKRRDYAGLTGLTETDDLDDAIQKAEQMVSDFEANHNVDELWARTNACTKATLEKGYKCGLMNKETFDKVSTMYEYYIPLRGFNETTSEQVYAYLTHEAGGFNSPLKTAEGRSSVADDPLATIANMADSAIAQGNKNMVKQRFLKFVMNHPSDLVSVNRMWLKYDDVNDRWEAVTADIDDSDTPDMVLQKTEAFEQKMEALAQSDPDHYKRGRDAANIPYRTLDGTLNEHQVHVKMGGQDYIVTINGNPRVAQAVNGMTNPDNENTGAVGAILKAGEYVNRQMSAFYTTRNPEFVLSNFLRDAMYANSTMWVRESPNYAVKFNRNFLKVNPKVMFGLMRKWMDGKLDMSLETEKLFYDFMMNGGETGYTVIKNVEQRKKEIKRYMKGKDSKIPVATAWQMLGEKLDTVNRAVENCARFAAFMTSRQMGRTIDRSVMDAKEVSVNFNKKGAGAKYMDKEGQTWIGKTGAFTSGIGRSFYVFWNAAVQGTTNFGRLHKNHMAKALAMDAGLFLMGALMAGLGGDDDEEEVAEGAGAPAEGVGTPAQGAGARAEGKYYNLPSYVRRSNICFKIPGTDSFVSIPLGIEQRAIYGLGELFASVASGKERMSGKEIAKEIAVSLSSLAPVDMMEGSGDLSMSALVPSYVKPVVEAYVTNKDWKGMKISNDTPFNEMDPEWTKANKRTNQYIVDFTRKLNEMTGGDDVVKGWLDVNPSKLEHLLEGTFGGVSTTVNKMVKMGETVTGKQEFDWRNMLMASRVIKSGDAQAEARSIRNEFYKYYDEYKETKRIVGSYETQDEDGIEGVAEKLDLWYNKPRYGRYEIVDDYEGDIKALRDEIKEETDPEYRKELEQELVELMREMNEEIRAFDDGWRNK